MISKIYIIYGKFSFGQFLQKKNTKDSRFEQKLIVIAEGTIRI